MWNRKKTLIQKKMEKKKSTNNDTDISAVIDIEKTGVFLSYQMLILLIGGLISLGITISVWNSYDSSIESNQKDIERIESMVEQRYKILDNRIEQRHDDVIKMVDQKYETIKEDVDENNSRFKGWLKTNTQEIDKLKEEQVKLKYSR